jgi:hypothetical protein
MSPASQHLSARQAGKGIIQFAWLWLRYQPGSALARVVSRARRHATGAHAADRHRANGEEAADRALALVETVVTPDGVEITRVAAAYLANGGALERAQEMAAHESPRTTKLYDRTRERLTQDEVERIRL